MGEERWMLPAGVIEILPSEAQPLENLRRRLLDTYKSWGYELLITPLIEYLDTLLVKPGDTLDLQTFKLIDQLTGRMMGVRADMTPQVARIEARQLQKPVPTRLCYLDTVLHTRPSKFAGLRTPIQLGAELYGYQGIAGDVEIIQLMIETMQQAGIRDYQIDIGHLGVYQEFLNQFTPEVQNCLLDIIKRRAAAELPDLVKTHRITATHQTWLENLLNLSGDQSILIEAQDNLIGYQKTTQALKELTLLAEQLQNIPIHFDLAEYRGYQYHTGLTYGIYVPNHGRALIKGGRYDLGLQHIGRPQPATGFSTNLTLLAALAPPSPLKQRKIFAPANPDPQLSQEIARLRSEPDTTVICELPEISDLPPQLTKTEQAQIMGCQYELQWKGKCWEIVAIST